MSYSNTERYETSRHEAIHCLAAVHFGIGVESVDVILGQKSLTTAGQTNLKLPCEAPEVPRLLRIDPQRAVQIVRGVIAVGSAPAADEGNPMNPSDKSVIDAFQRYWTSPSPSWSTVCQQAGQDMRQWLRQRETRVQIDRLTQILFVEGRLSGQPLQRALQRSIDPSKIAPRPPAPATQPQMSARAMLNEAVMKAYDYIHNPRGALYCKIFVPSQEDLDRERRTYEN